MRETQGELSVANSTINIMNRHISQDKLVLYFVLAMCALAFLIIVIVRLKRWKDRNFGGDDADDDTSGGTTSDPGVDPDINNDGNNLRFLYM